MIFSYNWLQSFFREKLPKPEQLAELLTMHIFEVEEIKKVGSDWAINIDVLPNRAADCFAHMGIAREIAAITNEKFQPPAPKLKESRKIKTKDFVTVEVRDKNDCSRYTAKVISKTKIGDSPSWMQERLKVCGLRPIMLETGQPLHAFDLNKTAKPRETKRETARKIIVRRAKKGEKILTLEGEAYELDENILTIADLEGPLVIAGIKGGKRAEVDEKTTTVLLEAANFNPSLTRRSSRQLGLKTDASLRFEHGLDINLTELAISRAAQLISEIAGGEAAQGIVDAYSKKAPARRVKLDFGYAEKLLGAKISSKDAKSILSKLGFEFTGEKSGSVITVVPSWRLDIELPEDVIEEIARIHGYNRIAPVFPRAALVPPARNDDIFWGDVARNILKENGLTEVYTYSFISENEAGIMGYGTRDLVEVANSASQDQKYMRPSLTPNLLKAVEKNQKQFTEIKVFELGKVFRRNVAEKNMLSGALSGSAFYVAKGMVGQLLRGLGISDIWYDEYRPTPEESKSSIWHKQKCAEIKSGKEEVGFLGEIVPRVLGQMGITMPVAVFDLDFEKLQKLATEEYVYRPVSKYPAAVRDLAVLVPRNTKSEEVLNIIEIAGGELVRDTDLFDIYEGEELPDGKKNLAFRIIYQAGDHTLTSGEIDKIHNKIINALEENPEWEARR